MSLPLDVVSNVTRAASAMGIPPDFVQVMLRDPEQLQKFQHMLEQSALMMGNRARTDSNTDTLKAMMKQLVDTSKRYKEDSEKERVLPPATAPPLRMEVVIAEQQQQRNRMQETSKPKDEGILTLEFSQTFLGLPQEFSSRPVSGLKPSV